MREHCYVCHKPRVSCVCASCTPVANRTEIIILQHPRERFHPIGTARLLRLGLRNARLEVFAPAEAKERPPPPLPEGAALLYPAASARELSTLAPQERPSALVILDGTWPHARSIYRAAPFLARLPHVALTPSAPSAYRIRREPAAQCLSTVEAVTLALRLLEPETPGLDGLMRAFTGMIDQHLQLRAERPSLPYKRRPRPRRAARLLPEALRETERLVLVSAEIVRRPGERDLVYLCAERLRGGGSFSGLARPRALPDARHLARMGLPGEDLLAADSAEALLRRFAEQLRPDDILVGWSQSVLDALAGLGKEQVLLKAVYCNHQRRAAGHLEDLLERHGLSAAPTANSGRAGRRLAACRAVLGFLSGVEGDGRVGHEQEQHEAAGRPREREPAPAA